MTDRIEDIHASLWYYEGRPDRHCKMVSWVGEEVTLQPLDGSPEFTTNGSFAWRVRESVTARTYPRFRVRRNSRGDYDAYLVKAEFTPELWVSVGGSIAGALWWVKQAPKPVARCCGAA